MGYGVGKHYIGRNRFIRSAVSAKGTLRESAGTRLYDAFLCNAYWPIGLRARIRSMDSGDCIRRHVGGADVDDGAVLSAEKSLVAIVLRRWGTVNERKHCPAAPGCHCSGMPLLRLQYRADEGEACP